MMLTQVSDFQTFFPKQNPFKIIYADITHKCNMNCLNCYVPNRSIPDMSLSKFKNLISDLPSLTEIRLIGGEPTLNPQLPQFISAVQSHNHRAVLVSNGLRLANADYLNSLYEVGLRFVYISFSGFNDNEVYLQTDNMRCAELKLSAVKNAANAKMEVGLGCLLARGINTHLISDLVSFADNQPTTVRINFRNIGKLGRHIQDSNFYLSMGEMIDLVSSSLGIKRTYILRFQKSPHQIRFPYRSKLGKVIWIKITDWQPEGSVLPDPMNLERGRITEDYSLAPFFEHVKKNEFNY